MNVLSIIAVLLSPLIAVFVQRRLDILREHSNRQKQIFESLMATRAAMVSPTHVQALNMIDLSFQEPKIFGILRESTTMKSVQDAWAVYRDHLNSPFNIDDRNASNEWANKREDLFVSLLFEMSNCLGYNFDRVVIKKGCYSPEAHGTLEQMQKIMQHKLVDVVTGKQPISIRLVTDQLMESQPTNDQDDTTQ